MKFWLWALAIFSIGISTAFFWYVYQSKTETLLIASFSPSLTIPLAKSPKNSDQSPATLCPDFINRFGKSAEELRNIVNSEPKSAQVLQGYRYFIGEIISSSDLSNIPLIVEIDLAGKISYFKCQKIDILRTSQDVEFQIPENDFKSIVQNIDNLEDEQAREYLKNFTTNPPEAKEALLQRIYQVSS